jgi:tRNA (guanine37-N1)-methyltransferase
VTLFPDMVRSAAHTSIVGRAIASGKLDLRVHDLRHWAEGKHRQADDTPFGGGAGMVMLCAPLFRAIRDILSDGASSDGASSAESGTNGQEVIPVVYTAPDGERFNQSMAREFARLDRMVIVCGHYEGVDERVREALVTREVSIGDYVLTGGELPALVMLDATVRLLPGVLGNAESAVEESFGATDGAGLLEYPQYTRPAVFEGRTVPDILLSGHHGNIAQWRRQQALVRTRQRRPDLWEKLQPLGKADQKLINAWDEGMGQAAGHKS